MRPIQTPQSNVALTMPGDQPPIPAERILFWDSSQGDTRDDARPGFVTRWMPTEEEAARLEAGACIELTIVGKAHPEVRVQVGRAVLPEAEIIARGHVDRALGLLYAQIRDRIVNATTQLVESIATLDIETDTQGALDAASDLIANGLDQVGAEVVGMPDPSTMATMWVEAVKTTAATLA